MSPNIRRVVAPLEPAALEAMDALMVRAYSGGSWRSSIDRFAITQPDGLFVAEEATDGGLVRVVGAGCGIAYPDAGFGWIGLIAVEPAEQRRGLGELVTEGVAAMLRSHGCAAVLDASPAGGPLYARMGFADHGVTRVLAAGEGWAAAGPPPRGLVDVDPGAVAALDAEAFGASRHRLLRVLLAQVPGRQAMALDRRGDVVGYVVATDTGIGPLVARDEATCRRLVAFARRLPWAAPPRICVPPGSGHLQSLLADGFDEVRRLRHMRREMTGLPGNASLVAGRLSLAEG